MSELNRVNPELMRGLTNMTNMDARYGLLEHGRTMLANKRKGKDEEIIAWAKDRNLYVYIGDGSGYAKEKRSVWHNPYNIKKHKITRERAVAEYREYLFRSPELLSRIDELRGKLLVCWCYPKPCHGNVLIEFLNEKDAT